MALSSFSKEDYQEHMDKSLEKNNDTIIDAMDLDRKLVEEYAASEASQRLVEGLFIELQEATSQNGTISPAHFDRAAFEKSDVYQARDEVHAHQEEYYEIKQAQDAARKQKEEAECIANMAWYEKTWEYGSTFVGEVSGYYDYVRVKDGVDSITGDKLSAAERVTSGAFAAASFIPFVGWGARIGKGVKGAYAVSKTVKMANASLDTYKAAKSFDYLRKADYGIYGLASANGLGEYVTGKDMFGNELNEEKRKESLHMAMSVLGSNVAGFGARKFSTHLGLTDKNAKVNGDRVDKVHLEKSINNELLKAKPKNSPTPKNWFEKDGDITIEKDGTWAYHDWVGNTIRYRNGYLDFKGAGFVEQEVKLKEFTTRAKDFREADKISPKNIDSTWHHHEDGRTLQEVQTRIHSRFTHKGGFSLKKK